MGPGHLQSLFKFSVNSEIYNFQVRQFIIIIWIYNICVKNTVRTDDRACEGSADLRTELILMTLLACEKQAMKNFRKIRSSFRIIKSSGVCSKKSTLTVQFQVSQHKLVKQCFTSLLA